MYIYKKKHNENYPVLWYDSLCQSIRNLNLPPNSTFLFLDARSSIIYNLYGQDWGGGTSASNNKNVLNTASTTHKHPYIIAPQLWVTKHFTLLSFLSQWKIQLI